MSGPWWYSAAASSHDTVDQRTGGAAPVSSSGRRHTTPYRLSAAKKSAASPTKGQIPTKFRRTSSLTLCSPFETIQANSRQPIPENIILYYIILYQHKCKFSMMSIEFNQLISKRCCVKNQKRSRIQHFGLEWFNYVFYAFTYLIT